MVARFGAATIERRCADQLHDQGRLYGSSYGSCKNWTQVCSLIARSGRAEREIDAMKRKAEARALLVQRSATQMRKKFEWKAEGADILMKRKPMVRKTSRLRH
jgi:hypothetical protein